MTEEAGTMSLVQERVASRDNPLYRLLEPETLADPYPLLAKWRESGPIETEDGSLIISDYATCMAILRDHAAMGNDTLASPAMRKVFPEATEEPVLNSIFFLDDPAHGRQRRLVTKAFTPRITARYEPWITGIVAELFAKFIADGEFDGVEDLATALSLGVIAKLLDIPAEDIPLLRAWSSDMALSTELPTLVASFHNAEVFTRDELIRLTQTSTTVHTYFADLIFKRRKNLGEDLISSLIRTEHEGRKLSRREITNTVATVFIAAHESTTNLITNGLLALSRHPGQLELLRQDPSLAIDCVDESLRYDCPILLIGRVALEGKRVNGIDIDKDTIVTLVIGSGNRDEREFPQADEFRIQRRSKSMGLAFGVGAHYCLGNSLAKLEAQIVFRTVAERLREFHVHEDSLSYRRHVVVRGLDTQRITFTA